ncbi:Bicarbonate transport ATP-binding protein CmpD [Anaerotruncus sp. 2789STDY5834896]|uniref:Bicarbonate transport ATP-binding protein CmpD n=1 Tax=uncultured Anaerotruncus sp. TaxID=905011 RepID=A0A1C6I3M1_9FIRM|nr:Bicarbonate transport ATP-binding protein CmpD [uncultured Anaerotruncus sp.]
MSDIVLRGITKRFGDKVVLEDLNARFLKGQTSCIMGPSGCGKTTLLQLLMGFLTPDEGTITGVPKKKSAVFQEDRLCEPFTAISNIKMVLGRMADTGRIRDHLRQLGLEEAALDKPVRDFSGGMKRRVSIARAVLFGGEVLFLDEPFKGLDAATREQAMDYVKRHTKGSTVLLITHDQQEARKMGGQLLAMAQRGEP